MKFLLLTDNTTNLIAAARYLGPYRVAHELEKNGIQTIVLDRFYTFPDFFGYVEQLLDESFVGIGISTTFFTPPDVHASYDRYTLRYDRTKAYYDYGIISKDESERIDWFRKLKEIMIRKSPFAKIFVGGAKAQFFPNKLYESISDIDYVVMGVTDMVFPQILKEVAETGSAHHKVLGNKKVVDTMNRYIQPKACPKHEWMPHWFIQKNEVLPLEVGRGCAFNCKFCNYDKRANYRKTNADLRDELISNYERHGVRLYHFIDDCYNDSRVKVEEVSNVIASLPFKIEWVAYMRFDVAVKFPHTMEMAVESGGRGFYWGVESLTHEVARRAGKGTDPEAIKDFIMNFSRKYRNICYSTGSFISGLPGETEKSWRDQIEWLINNENFDFAHMGALGIIPFKAEFDGSVIDYADYSRDPKKYGFQEIDMATGYWRHETMSRPEAIELATWAFELWEQKKSQKKGISFDVWNYTFLRSFDFSPEEVSEIYFSVDPVKQKFYINEYLQRNKARAEKYFSDMQTLLVK